MNAEHVCQCYRCTPDLAVPRLGENHLAVRFGQDHRNTHVSLDGVELDDCLELLAGADGWVLRASRHECRRCRRGICLVRQHGLVSVWQEPEP